MTWDMSDMKRLKPGLSTEEKRCWLASANAALQKARSNGVRNSEIVAIREADSVLAKRSPKSAGVESAIRGEYFQAEIEEASLKEAEASGKRELVVTLLKEGPGNQYHKNWYKKGALESAQRELRQRPKQYFNHAKDVDNPDRDLRDWASSIIETWIDSTGGTNKLKARVRVYDNWLWERAKQAPQELAVSIEGKGMGKSETIEGGEYNAIYEIQRCNGVNWVDYPGNAGMGVQVLEKDKQIQNQEDKKMELTDILEGLKGLSQEQLKEVAATRPELKEFFMFQAPVADEKTSKEMAELKESVEKIKADAEAKAKADAEKLAVIEKEKLELANKVEAQELRAKEATRVSLAESLLSSSKLKAEHKTDVFKSMLLAVRPLKDGDKEVSESDQMKKLIADREAVCIAEVAKPEQGKDEKAPEVAVEEQTRLFVKNVFGATLPEPEAKK